MADALTLSRLGLCGFGNYGGGYNAAFTETAVGDSISNAMNLNNYQTMGFNQGMVGYNTTFPNFNFNMMDNFVTNPMIGNFTPSFGSMGMYGMSNSEYAEWQNLSTIEREERLANLKTQRMEHNAQLQARYDDINFTNQIRRAEKQTQYNVKLAQTNNATNATTTAVNAAALNLKTVIQTNRKDEVLEKYNKLQMLVAKDPLNQKLENGITKPLEGEELIAKTREIYQKAMGTDIIADIDANLAGSFTQGLKTSFSLGFLGDKEDADTLKEKILGLRRDGSNAIARGAGRVAGPAAVGAAIGCIGGPVGAAIGAGIGGAIGLISSLF